jgi:aminopeptidase N
MKVETPRPVQLKDYRPPSYLIDKVDLLFALDPKATRVRARLSVRANPEAEGRIQPLRLDGKHFELVSIALDGEQLSKQDYRQTEDSLTLLRTPREPFALEIETLVDPEANKALQGLYRTKGIYCSQCEAEGFRRLTYFLDRPDVLATYTVRIEADPHEAPVLLSNGNPLERGLLDGGRRHYAIWHDPFPKPCYLFALVGGDLSSIASTFRTMSGREIQLGIYVEHGKEARAAWAMDCLKRAMRWDEQRFGREYDLDVFNIVAVSDFNMGAMENKGLNVFNDRLILASPDTATDSMFEAIESVVAHEYFHNWTGNRITCRDWFQLCLKEGLTVFRDQEFSGEQRSPTVQRIGDVRGLKSHQFAEDAGPLAHPVRPESYIEINNFYTSTVYEKGAEVVRMLQSLLGRETFRKGMDLYFARHDGRAATVEDFLECFEEVSARDLTQFRLWYSQSGTPELVCALRYDKTKRRAELEVEQVLPATPGQPHKKPMYIPLRVGLLSDNGDEVALKGESGEPFADGILSVTKRKQTFRFADVASRPVPSLLRDFSAPVNVTIDLPERDIEFLMTSDGDLFNRWQAANTYATRTLTAITRGLAQGKQGTQGLRYANALGAAMTGDALDPAYCAELLRLPTQADIARVIGKNVDPSLIYRAHRRLAGQIGRTLGGRLEAIYAEMTDDRPFSPDPASAGRRALRNSALTLLTARRTPRDIERLTAHYFSATNMTDRAHALFLLATEGGAEAARALAHFHKRWKGDHVVIDTWFAAQAQSPRAGTLKTVQALTRDPLFHRTAPNKVRALIGTFAAGNPVQFNRPDGAGYAFVADEVLQLDGLNPQVAARMVGAFRSWRSLESGRRTQARKALQRISKAKGLSSDVQEIVAKMIDA